jgi:exodeoxyribonuclease-3
MKYKIISFNVNGIRAALRKGLGQWLQYARPDIIGFQEIKAGHDQIDKEFFRRLGYTYQYWFPAKRKGYSGTALISKIKPEEVVLGTGTDFMDDEGRTVLAVFKRFSVMSLYLPSGTNAERLAVKFRFMDRFYKHISDLMHQTPGLIVSGDYNICHRPIDIHDPVRLQHVSGFLPEERKWLQAFMDLGFTDTFRMFDTRPEQYTWWSYRAAARQRNKGWRIDYHLAHRSLNRNIRRSLILKDAVFSDHVPVLLELEI